MCSGKGIGHWIRHPPIMPLDSRCQSIRQGPLVAAFGLAWKVNSVCYALAPAPS